MNKLFLLLLLSLTSFGALAQSTTPICGAHSQIWQAQSILNKHALLSSGTGSVDSLTTDTFIRLNELLAQASVRIQTCNCGDLISDQIVALANKATTFSESDASVKKNVLMNVPQFLNPIAEQIRACK